MEAALCGLASTVKHSASREAITQAREVFKKYTENGDVPVGYLREKCLVAIELAFDHGNEKHSQFAVDAVQTLIRDKTYRDTGPEDANQHIATQILHSVTGIEQWNGHLQCKCVTVLVEMVCNNELKITLQHVEECLQIYKRLFGGSEEESVRVACRAASSQSISSYFFNRYSNCDGEQKIAVFMDVSKLLEELVADLERMTSSHEQSLVLLDAVSALLSLNDQAILSHQPFSNLLWEKVCPLLILLLGVPQKAAVVSSTAKLEKDEPVGQGQAEFALSPSVTANPDFQRALYQIVDQVTRLMIGSPQLHSSLEALFHKAFLFPKIGQRMEALKTIRKMVSDPIRLCEVAMGCVQSRSQSLWRMMIASVAECANPQVEVSIEAVRAVVALLQGMLEFTSKEFLTDSQRKLIDQTFPSFERTFAKSFTLKSNVSLPSTDIPLKDAPDDDEESDVFVEGGDQMSETLRRLEQKFRTGSVTSSTRKSSECDECSEKSTAQKFVESLCEAVDTWAGLKNTLALDETILQFAAGFYSKFCAAHEERFKNKSKVQQEFLNTDAIYLSVYASLSYAARPESFSIEMLKKQVLSTGCVVHVSESWLEKVFYNLKNSSLHKSLTPLIRDLVSDYDGSRKRILSDVEKLRRIEKRQEEDEFQQEKAVGRWLMSGAWQLIVEVLSTFQGAKGKGKVREKLRDAVENSIKGVRLFAHVAQQLEMSDRCGWIFANLVESSCCLEDIRNAATTDDEKKWMCTSREQLLSMELVLDQAHVAIHAPNCWKHIIRCTEYVWELEKYIYGALCYEKTSRLSFFRKADKDETTSQSSEMDSVDVADRRIEKAIGDQLLSLHSINRALAVLIAKVDRFYAKLPRELCLPAFCDLCIALISSSENRIFYGGQKAAALTNSVTLLTRLSEVISTLSRRPLVHQIFIWPLVSSHFVKVCECVEESRMAATALADTASGLLIQELAGVCFNHSLIVPFQTATCSDGCQEETKEQLVCSLSSFVSQQAEKIGSGWKPLFGCLRAVRISKAGQSGPQWAVVDVISAYLNINKPAVISASLIDCTACVTHLLQCHEQQEETEIAQATLRLLPAIYSLILNMYTVPHAPNFHLLHRCELRAKCLEEVEISILDTRIPSLTACIEGNLQLDENLRVAHGPFPWEDKQSHEIASVELFLSYMEHLCGTLLTSESVIQTSLLDVIQTFLVEISKTTLGAPIGGLCMSNVVLPYVQKWIRRPETDGAKTLKQAIGKFTQTVVEMLQQPSFEPWADRLLRDICAVCIECCRHEKTASAAPAYFALIVQEAPKFTQNQWDILSTALWIATSTTLVPIRTMCSFYLVDCRDESGDVGQILLQNHGRLPIQQFLLAQQVLAASQKELNGLQCEEDGLPEPLFVCTGTDGFVEKIRVGWLVQSLFTQSLIQQLVSSLILGSSKEETAQKVIGTMPRIDSTPKSLELLYSILEAAAVVFLEVDKRPALCSLLSKATSVKNANLLKGLVAANTAISLSFLDRYERKEDVLQNLSALITKNAVELKRVEQKICKKRSAMYNREHDENKYHLIPVTFQDEIMYKLVSNEHVENTYNEYEKHRERLKPQPERKNPFSEVISEALAVAEQPENGIDQESDSDEERLAAYRDICLQPLKRLFSVSQKQGNVKESLNCCRSALQSVILASPDLSVRKITMEIVEFLLD